MTVTLRSCPTDAAGTDNSMPDEQIGAIGEAIRKGDTALGIELGSTRIKALLIGPDHQPIAVGGHAWENRYLDSIWTYPLEAVWDGLRHCVADLMAQVHAEHGVHLRTVGALGVSAMMHGYLAFDRAGELLTPFRTWRNTTTTEAAEQLTATIGFNIPQRWSIAHLYQAVLDREPHTDRITHLTTLAGYVHWQLTGKQVIGVGDASGMFPIDVATGQYDSRMMATFDKLAAAHGFKTPLQDLLPTVRVAGAAAGHLTDVGAHLLDPSGQLLAGAPMCPPEGDAGTGMVATNSIAPRTGNISAGTSIFAMIVLENPLEQVHTEIDLVATPDGHPVAMVHCNNGASELDSWASLFTELTAALGQNIDKSVVFDALMRTALEGDADGGGLTAYNFLSGEPIAKVEQGRPLLLRGPESHLTLANFMRSQIFASLATLRMGMDILQVAEHVTVSSMFAHGGLFRTAGVAHRLLAAAINTPVSVGATATEGGAWGIAVLARYLTTGPEQTLDEFLRTSVFVRTSVTTLAPDPTDRAGFDTFLDRFVTALPVERTAANWM